MSETTTTDMTTRTVTVSPDPIADRQMQYLADRIADVELCLQEGAKRMDDLTDSLATNTHTTNEVRDILGAAKGFFRFASAAGVFLKWTGGIAAALTAIYVAVYTIMHGGTPPTVK